MKLRVCDIAVRHLRETDNPAVMWGDCGLLDDIADLCGMKCDGSKWMGGIFDRQNRLLNALSKCPGALVSRLTWHPNCGRRVRIFYLPEQAPLGRIHRTKDGL